LFKIKKNILVVDDDSEIQIFIHKVLTNFGYNVLLSKSTEEALSLIIEYVPHLVLLDINLIDEFGYTLLDKMVGLDLLDKINVYIISSDSSKQAIMLSKEYGVQGYLVKPFNNQTLVSTVKGNIGDHEFDEIVFEENQQKLSVQIPAEIIKFNELSVSIRSKVKFSSKQYIEIHSDFFEKLNIPKGHLQVYQASRDITPGLYDTTVQIIGIPEKTLQSIRKIQKKKV